MSWVIKKQFRLIKEPTKHYILRHSNNGNSEINVPKNITNKFQAVQWLKAHPNKIANPNRFKNKIKHNIISIFKKSPGGTIKLANTSSNLLNKLDPKVSYNCSIRSKLFNGRIGYRPLNNAKLKPSKSLVSIGKGRQGVVFAASVHANGAEPFAIKVSPQDILAKNRKEIQPAQAEFNINNAAYFASPYGVIRPINLVFCLDFIAPSEINMNNVQNSNEYNKNKQSVMFMQLASEGSLQEWLNKMVIKKPAILDDNVMLYIIGKVCVTLKNIQSKYPEFRHNDLHIGNIFVDSVSGILIADFGWARLYKTGTNPAVNTIKATSSHAKTWGVGQYTDIRYDHHLFLNDLRSWVIKNKKHSSDGFKKTIKFLDVVIPPGYRGDKDTHVESSRLKYQDPCPGLPTLEQILNNEYLGYGQEGKIMYFMKFTNLKAGKAASPKKALPKAASPKKALPKAASPKKIIPVKKATALNQTVKNKIKVLYQASMKKKTPTKVLVNASPPKVKKHITKAILKNKRFDKLVEEKWKSQGSKSNKNFDEAWQKARQDVIRNIENKLSKNKSPFSPPKKITPPPKKIATPPPKKIATPSPPPKKIATPPPKKIATPPPPPKKIATPPPPPKKPLQNSKQVLNTFTRNKNVSAITIKNLKKSLIQVGYSETNAKIEATKWANAWGKQLTNRRATLGWIRGNNQRLRMPGVRKGTLKLLDLSLSNLQKFATNHKIPLTIKGKKKTKIQLMNSLFNGKL
jgi:hypothetical protein